MIVHYNLVLQFVCFYFWLPVFTLSQNHWTFRCWHLVKTYLETNYSTVLFFRIYLSDISTGSQIDILVDILFLPSSPQGFMSLQKRAAMYIFSSNERKTKWRSRLSLWGRSLRRDTKIGVFPFVFGSGIIGRSMLLQETPRPMSCQSTPLSHHSVLALHLRPGTRPPPHVIAQYQQLHVWLPAMFGVMISL